MLCFLLGFSQAKVSRTRRVDVDSSNSKGSSKDRSKAPTNRVPTVFGVSSEAGASAKKVVAREAETPARRIGGA